MSPNLKAGANADPQAADLGAKLGEAIKRMDFNSVPMGPDGGPDQNHIGRMVDQVEKTLGLDKLKRAEGPGSEEL